MASSPMRRPKPNRTALRHRLVRVDAPDIAAPDPAGDVAGLDPAPIRAAFEEVADDPWLSPRDHCGGRVGLAVERPHPALDDDLALAGQHPLMHPALGPLPIADAPPMLKLSGDLDRQVLAGVDPVDRIAVAGAG